MRLSTRKCANRAGSKILISGARRARDPPTFPLPPPLFFSQRRPEGSSPAPGDNEVGTLIFAPFGWDDDSMASGDRVRTYIQGFDEKLSGGIPEGSIVLLCGEPGTMKSTLAAQDRKSTRLNSSPG